jgi:hypothetical protein
MRPCWQHKAVITDSDASAIAGRPLTVLPEIEGGTFRRVELEDIHIVEAPERDR